MSEVKYSKEHEWIKIEGDVGTIGITQHATEMLGDIVFVELPDLGSSVEKDGNAGVVESTKAASDVFTPISGEIERTKDDAASMLSFMTSPSFPVVFILPFPGSFKASICRSSPPTEV